MNDWIQSHANAHAAGNGKQEPDLRGIKLISPFPGTSTLLAAQLTSGGVIEEPEERPAASHSSEDTSMRPGSVALPPIRKLRYLILEFTKLYIH